MRKPRVENKYNLKVSQLYLRKQMFDEILNFIQKIFVYLIVVIKLFKIDNSLLLGDFIFYISITFLLSSSCSSFC